MNTKLFAIRLDEYIIKQLKQNARKLKLKQTEYVKAALELKHHHMQQTELIKQMEQASFKVRDFHLKTNQELTRAEYE